MIWVVVVFVLLHLWSESKPGPGLIDREKERVRDALADAPNRVLRAAGLSVDGDPSEVSRTDFVPDPSRSDGGSV